MKKKRKKHSGKVILRISVIVVLVAVTSITYCSNQTPGNNFVSKVSYELSDKSEYPSWLKEMVKKNPEACDFANNYKDRSDYQGKEIDLSGECKEGTVPRLFQWDKRWGYDKYGEDYIGVAGCGPTCLSMAYIFLTGDTSLSPREMSEYSYENGYYTNEGTAWSLWTEGVSGLGLKGTTIPLDEKVMKNHLDDGEVIICSMQPGDFTTSGHFILIRGYNKKGFLVNDPNRCSNSEKQWPYDKIEYQIKSLWSLSR